MPKPYKYQVVSTILEVELLPVFYNGNVEVAKKIVQSCVDGGVKAIEFTNRGDLAYQVFSELSEWCEYEMPHVVIGAGTILEPETASLYINSGANFIVSPILNSEIAVTCHRRRVTHIPGCQTPSEISEAEEMGVNLIKVFPAQVLTPAFIKAVLGPCPNSLLMPSGGVKASQKDIVEWIQAGAKT
jgi:2-dehydro-3-deoxyphosphogluconate aldolase/(4S)-4-hydroxy-2-oxoglutarate aldolase